MQDFCESFTFSGSWALVFVKPEETHNFHKPGILDIKVPGSGTLWIFLPLLLGASSKSRICRMENPGRSPPDPEKHGCFADRCLRLTARCAQKVSFLSVNPEIILDASRHPGFPRKFPISGWKA